MKRNIFLWGFLMTCFFVSVVFYVRIGNTPDDKIKIGVAYGFTGASSTWAEYGRMGLQLALDEINGSGGVNGRLIELVYEDTTLDPTKAISAYRKLVHVDRVSAVIGDVWGFVTNPIIPVANKEKVILISPTVMGESVVEESQYFYTMGHSVESQEDALDLFLDRHSSAKTAFYVCWKDNWGQAHYDMVYRLAQKHGVDIAGHSCSNSFSNDYRIEALKIKELNPDIVFVTASLADVVLKAFHENGIDKPIFMTSIVPDAIESRGMSIELARNVEFSDWRPSDQFIEKFKNKYGIYPVLEAQNHYETLMALAEAIKNSPNDLSNGIRNVKYDGVTGLIDFTNSPQTKINREKAGLYKVTELGYEQLGLGE